MILAIPIKNQYEQYCNAAALSEIGVITVNQIGPSFSNTVQNWIDDAPIVQLEEVAEIDELAELLFRFTSIRKGKRSKVSTLQPFASTNSLK